MEKRYDTAVAALSQPTRMDVVGLLMRCVEGVPAGEIGRRIGSTQNNMSTHLKVLAEEGLVVATRDGRRILYTANAEKVREVVRAIAARVGSLPD